jgi:hypothetical protein
MVNLIMNRVPNQPWHRRMNRVVVCDLGFKFFDVSVLTAYSKPLVSSILLQQSCSGIWLWHLALAYLALAYLALFSSLTVLAVCSTFVDTRIEHVVPQLGGKRLIERKHPLKRRKTPRLRGG